MNPGWIFKLLLLTICVLSVSACGTFEVGVERTPTPNVLAVTAPATATDDAPVKARVVTSTTAIRLTAQAAAFSATLVPTSIPETTATATPVILTAAPASTSIPTKQSQSTPLRDTATPLSVPSVAPTATQVNCGDSPVWFFDYQGACSEGSPLYSYAAAQRFEHGQMIWVEAIDVFYLLFDEGFYPGDSRQVYRSVGPLVLKPGASKDNRVGETPPAGYVEPVSGFGLIWRNEVDGLGTDIRAALGWAREPEFGFDTVLQCEQQLTYSSRT